MELIDQLDYYYKDNRFNVGAKTDVEFYDIAFDCRVCKNNVPLDIIMHDDDMSYTAYYFDLSFRDEDLNLYVARYYYYTTAKKIEISKVFGNPVLITGLKCKDINKWEYDDVLTVKPEEILPLFTGDLLLSAIGCNINLVNRLNAAPSYRERLGIIDITLPDCKCKKWLYVDPNEQDEDVPIYAISLDHTLFS